MVVNVRSLTTRQTRWIERCAGRLRIVGPVFTHMEAVQLAFNLYRAWPGLDPVDAADAFMAPEGVAA